MKSQKLILPVLALTVVGAGVLLRAGLVKATSTGPQSGLIQYLSQKFNLDQTKVETAVTEYRTQERTDRQKQMTENYTVYLDGLVKEGKITEAQKTTLLAKHSELQKSHESAAATSQSREDRRTQMDKERTDLEAWAKSQGIDISYLQFGFGGRGMMGRGGQMRGDNF